MFILKGKVFRKDEKTSQKGNRFFNYVILDEEFDKYYVASDVNVPEDVDVEMAVNIRAYASRDGRAGLNIWATDIQVKKGLKAVDKKSAAGGVVV